MVFYLLFFSLLSTTHSLYSDLLAGFASASFLLLINLFTKGRGMGLGDVKFAVMGGIIIGLKFSPIWLFLSFLTGGVAGIILILLGRAALKDRVAFGPFLITGLLLTFVLGSKLLSFLGF
ncbi:MAG: putative type IV leader peptidase/N-methyltransferase [Candidatus Woesebacteria bacterium GW2011_GWA2_40_7]|nr:MAG: putative type IV leader peptidase/N-methyltransferase [Candidatus Woesebacteria bacterium GW2011_GWA2_40_7]